jgi:hypothetical protein
MGRLASAVCRLRARRWRGLAPYHDRGRIVEPREGEKDMAMRRVTVGILAGALALSGSAALAQGDPEKGERVFNKCKPCHVADEQKNTD